MKDSGYFFALLISLICLFAGKETSFQEDIISIIIVFVILLIVVIIFLLEIKPVLILKLSREGYKYENNLEEYENAVNLFFQKHHPKEKEYLGWIMLAEIHLIKAEFTDGLNDLAYISIKDFNSDDDRYYLLYSAIKCRLLLFLNLLKEDNTDLQHLQKYSANLDKELKRQLYFINYFLDIDNSEEKVNKAIEKLSSQENIDQRALNEFYWLKGIQAKNKGNHPVVIDIHNKLIINHAPQYLIKTFNQHKEISNN